MRREIWIGTRGYEGWAPAPAYNADFSKKGWAAITQLISGGASVLRSKAAHAEYNMAWTVKSRSKVRLITDLAAGVFGDGLIYFIDPMATDTNVLPMHWAFPGQAELGAPPLIFNYTPTFTATPANGLRYPVRSAVYTTTATSDVEKLYIPIPPGHSVHVGFHGSTTGSAGVQVSQAGAAAVKLTPLAVTNTTRTNSVYSAAASTGSNIEISLVKAAGTIVMSGLIIQILPTGATVPVGNFISGQGHSGCVFEVEPQTTAYSAALDLQGMTAKLTEVGAWLPR